MTDYISFVNWHCLSSFPRCRAGIGIWHGWRLYMDAVGRRWLHRMALEYVRPYMWVLEGANL